MSKARTPAAAGLQVEVERVFRAAYPLPDFVDVSPGYRSNVHVVIVSRKFDNMTERQKHDTVWEIAREHFGKDAQRISILLAYSPDELKG